MIALTTFKKLAMTSAGRLLCCLALALLAVGARASVASSHGDLLGETKYGVVFVQHPLREVEVTAELLALPTTMSMWSPTGERVVCTLPDAEAAENAGDDAKSATAGVSGSDSSGKKTPSLESLLEPLDGVCIFRLTGWWTYELCFGRHLRQFHEDAEKKVVTVSYFLGLQPDDAE